MKNKILYFWKKTNGVIYPLLIAILIIILWQTNALNKMLDVSEIILPTPTTILRVLGENIGNMTEDIRVTLTEIIVGLVLGSVLGYGLAVLTALFPVAGKGGISLVTAFNAIPIIAMTPVLMNLTKLLPSADSNTRSMIAKIMVTTLVSMSSMSITAYRGLTELKPFSEDLLTSYATNKGIILWKLRMPNSIPYVFTALKIGIPTAVISAVVSEYFTETNIGVGYKIKDQINSKSAYSVGWSYIAIACLIGISLYLILMIIRGITLRHRKA